MGFPPRATAVDSVLATVFHTNHTVRARTALVHQPLDTGEVLFWRGEVTESVFFVESGELSIWRESSDGEQELLRFAGPGDVITPDALLSTSAIGRTCLVERAATVWVLARPAFERLTAMDPDAAGSVLEALAEVAATHPDSGNPMAQPTWLDRQAAG